MKTKSYILLLVVLQLYLLAALLFFVWYRFRRLALLLKNAIDGQAPMFFDLIMGLSLSLAMGIAGSLIILFGMLVLRKMTARRNILMVTVLNGVSLANIVVAFALAWILFSRSSLLKVPLAFPAEGSNTKERCDS